MRLTTRPLALRVDELVAIFLTEILHAIVLSKRSSATTLYVPSHNRLYERRKALLYCANSVVPLYPVLENISSGWCTKDIFAFQPLFIFCYPFRGTYKVLSTGPVFHPDLRRNLAEDVTRQELER